MMWCCNRRVVLVDVLLWDVVVVDVVVVDVSLRDTVPLRNVVFVI